jgi:hypothetical protein
MKKAGVFILMVLLIACSDTEIPKSQKSVNEFYAALNVILTSKFPGNKLILNETVPVYRTAFGYNKQPSSSDTIPTLPPPDIVYYPYQDLKYLVNTHQIDLDDMNYMYNSIDSTKTLQIDSLKVSGKFITPQMLNSIFRDQSTLYSYRVQKLERLYGTSSILRVSTPIFNPDFTCMLITISQNNKNHKLGLTKKTGKWTIYN